jgi:Uncharacterized protein family UPF0029
MVEDESLDLALADLEILQSAYPDEIKRNDTEDDTSVAGTIGFPLHVTLQLSETGAIMLEFTHGYPTRSNVQIVSVRSNDAVEYGRLEQAAAAIRHAAQSCLEDGIEGGLACCAAAFDAWTNGCVPQQQQGGGRGDFDDDDDDYEAPVGTNEGDRHCEHIAAPSADHNNSDRRQRGGNSNEALTTTSAERNYHWISGETLLDRKSTFQAHACRVSSDDDVACALRQLIDGSSKIQRATHNMVRFAYVLMCRMVM